VLTQEARPETLERTSADEASAACQGIANARDLACVKYLHTKEPDMRLSAQS
jgi:hypothetical protein